jgi:26S proteasome regulatory subunit N1
MAGPESVEQNKQPEGTKDDGKKPVEVKDEDLSEEDKQLKEELELCVERLKENDTNLYRPALETLRQKIRESTSSMTGVPKPLKFMRPFYNDMITIYEKIHDVHNKNLCADIVSVLAMTTIDTKEVLKYRLLGSNQDIGMWGHEYIRHLSADIALEWESTETNAELRQRLLSLTNDIIPFLMRHNAEADACDLLMEIEQLDLIETFVDKDTFSRVCLYLTSCVPYVPEPDDTKLLRTACKLYRHYDQYPLALRCAIQLNDMDLIRDLANTCPSSLMKKQLAFMLGRQQIIWNVSEVNGEDPDELTNIMSNSHLTSNFLALARELDIMEAKLPEDIYKTYLDNTNRPSYSQPDSSKQNLASAFVNGFVNAAFGQDKIVTQDSKWLTKYKDNGLLSATASLGLIVLWDVDGGLSLIDKYLYSSDDNIKAGALLACGIVNCGVQNDCDPALALLGDYVSHKDAPFRVGSIVGLGLAYAGTNRSDVIEMISNALREGNPSMEIISLACLSIGIIAVGSCNADVSTTLLTVLLERSEIELKEHFAKFIALAIGLLFLSKGEAVEPMLESLKVITEPLRSFATVLVECCAYAGTGNVLKIQHMLHICSEHFENKDEKKEGEKETSKDKDKDKKKEDEIASQNAAHQAAAVLGIAMIAMGEEIGSEMALRSFGHLLRYGEPVIKRAVPLALALLSVSNPKLNIIDTLSKFSHDADHEVSYNSIFAMGIVGAGTNNARLAAMLRQLAVYHGKDMNNLFMVRLAQGLTHLGKGTMTLNPYHSDRMLLCRVSLAGLLTVLVSFFDVKQTIVGKYHYLLYFLALAIQPRMLVTFDESLRPLPVPVRVGQAVDVVGQAGKPKTITGFQTHTTPVLLAYGERAELATEEYLTLTPVLEGFVILQKNPNYVP